MAGGPIKEVEDRTPDTVWDALKSGAKTALVDCRTSHEWQSIGLPDLSSIGKSVICVEWRKAPDMSVNEAFKAELEAALKSDAPDQLFFICRSGARSKEAASFIQTILSSNGVACECINVAEGFEGNPDANGVRGHINGWKARDLPWTTGS